MSSVEQQRLPIGYRVLAVGTASLLGWIPIVAWWAL
jgi:hypothetical protein